MSQSPEQLAEKLRELRFLGEYGSTESLPEDYVAKLTRFITAHDAEVRAETRLGHIKYIQELERFLSIISEWQHQGRDMGHTASLPFTQCPHHMCRKATDILSNLIENDAPDPHYRERIELEARIATLDKVMSGYEVVWPDRLIAYRADLKSQRAALDAPSTGKPTPSEEGK